MRLVTCRSPSGDAVAVLDGDYVIPLRELVPEAPGEMLGVIAADEPLRARLAAALQSAPGAARRPLGGVELRAPIPRPGKILCLGLNYAAHAKEGGNEVPEHPTVFVRVTTSLVAPGAPVVRPRVSEQLDYEVELVIVIGARCHDVAEDQALAHVFGYTIMNDVSVRDYQRRTSQWTLGKNFDGSGPMGPAIVTADELPAGARGLGIRTRLNGELLQDGNTADMVFPVPRIVALLSQVMTLEPGDVIATGTPSGVGHARRPPLWMKPGDVVTCEIDGIGTLSNPIVDAVEAR
ncbi:MAG: 5-oxopent-3-ene,2,5-tricarboxylate decarboxylase [Geminicoccaceae bacterium]|nr:5-oxopent-3-ene,2,5-tricarboxylate decarboxylase [Geminicoccaceae bacterium]